MGRILTAISPTSTQRVRRILAGHNLRLVLNLAAAKAALDPTTNLIVVGARFDHSRMFDLLDYIRKDVEHCKIPVVAALIMPTTMSRETIAGLACSTKIWGASRFINLNDFRDDETDNARIRMEIEALLLPTDIIPGVAASAATKGRGDGRVR